MRKYITVCKMILLETLQYVVDLLISTIAYAMIVFIFMMLWKYMFKDSDLIAGYTFNQMAWYVAITEILWFTIRPGTIKKIVDNDIRSGQIAYRLNKPYNYLTYLMSLYMGYSFVSIAFKGVVGIIIAYLIIGPLYTFNLMALPFILIIFFMAMLVFGYTYMAVSMISFWVERNGPFMIVYDKIMLITGTIFPVEVFPAFIRPIIKYSPVAVTIYAPAKMIVDYSNGVFREMLFLQIIYLFVAFILCNLIYGRGVKKLNVNGG